MFIDFLKFLSEIYDKPLMINVYLKALFLTIFLLPSFALDTFEYDNNNDGKPDNILIYDGASLIEQRNDRNFDGEFDYISKKVNDAFIVTYDDNFDGQIDREDEVSYSGIEEKRNVTKYKYIDGKKTIYASYSFATLQKSECDMENFMKDITSIENFLSDFKPIINTLGGGFSEITPGVQVHDSCFDNFSKKSFTKLAANALSKGVSCLKDLAKQNKQETIKGELPNLLNFFDAQLSGKKKSVSIICHEKDDWSDSTIAHASTDKTSPKGLKEITHPFVSINPKIRTSIFGAILDGPDSKEEMEGILFHEMIHNFGYLHGSGIDITYGCETCCFSDDKEAQKSACKLCAGNYKTEFDSRYIRDIAEYSKNSRLIAAEVFYYRNIIEIENNQENLSSLFVTLSNRGLGVQSAFLKELDKRKRPLNKTKDIEQAKNYRGHDENVDKANNIFAQALATLYIDKDIKGATKLLSTIDSYQIHNIAKSNYNRNAAFDAQKLSRGIYMLTASIKGLAPDKQTRKTLVYLSSFYSGS